jgi:hypothetical protein
MRVRSHEKCVSAVALTWNLLVSSLGLSSGIELTSIFSELGVYPDLSRRAQDMFWREISEFLFIAPRRQARKELHKLMSV